MGERGDVHDAFLRALEPQLAELKEVSLALGHALDTQNRQLERLDDKVETMHDSLKRVSLQAKRLAGGSSALGATFRFRCALQDVASGKFVRDVEGDALLGYGASVAHLLACCCVSVCACERECVCTLC